MDKGSGRSRLYSGQGDMGAQGFITDRGTGRHLYNGQKSW